MFIAATVGFNDTILTVIEGSWGVVELCAVMENFPPAGLGSQLTLQLERINIKSGNTGSKDFTLLDKSSKHKSNNFKHTSRFFMLLYILALKPGFDTVHYHE